jgi:hypothetical protein
VHWNRPRFEDVATFPTRSGPCRAEGGARDVPLARLRSEALLKDRHDQAGGTRDLMVLAHSIDDSFASMAAVGLGDAIGEQ